MPAFVIGSTFTGTCTGCCGPGTGTCDCEVCGECMNAYLSFQTVTVTAVTGFFVQMFFEGVTGVSGAGTAGPYVFGNHIDTRTRNCPTDASLGIRFVFSVTCYTDLVRILFLTEGGFFSDCVNGIDSLYGQAVFPSTNDPFNIRCTITMSTLVCDIPSGFVSVDFTIDCGVNGTFSGQIT